MQYIKSKSGAYFNDKVKLTKDDLLRCRDCFTPDSTYYNYIDSMLKDSIEEIEMGSNQFIDILCECTVISDRILAYKISELTFKGEIVDKYNELLKEYEEFRKIGKSFFDTSELYGEARTNSRENYIIRVIKKYLNGDEGALDKALYFATELKNLEAKIYKLRDLVLAKEDIVTNLKYILTEEQVKEYDLKYEAAIEKLDIDLLEKLLADAQKLILDHWNSYVSDVDTFKPGDDFRFICHSTSSSYFKGDFWTRYVSCSLLAPGITETYRNGFGFILAPNNIVGAKSKDMYVINSADSEEKLLNYSSIKKIDIPERIVSETRERQNYNPNNDSLFNEIVIDGFKPIAIFCLTNGGLTLNYNYVDAHKLKEQYKDLKIIEIDVTMYQEDIDFVERKRLIGEIIARSGGNRYYDNDILMRFDWFWNSFLELKKKGQYTEEDIIALYNQNKDYLSIFVDIKKIFESNYSDEEIKYILLNNYKVSLRNVYIGTANAVIFDRIYSELYELRDNPKLESMFPGISTFLKLYHSVLVTDELQCNLSKATSMTMAADIISEYIRHEEDMKYQELVDITNEAFKGEISYITLSELYDKLSMLDSKVLSSDKVVGSKTFVKLFPLVMFNQQLFEKLSMLESPDFNMINSLLIDNIEFQKKSKQDKIAEYESSIESIKESINQKELENRKYDEASEALTESFRYSLAKMNLNDIFSRIESINVTLNAWKRKKDKSVSEKDELTSAITDLSKHKFINRLKIITLSRYKLEKEKDIEFIVSKISELESSISELEKTIIEAKEDFFKTTGYKYDIYEESYEENERIVRETNYFSNRYDIEILKLDIEKNMRLIENIKKEIFDLDEVVEEVRKR